MLIYKSLRYTTALLYYVLTLRVANYPYLTTCLALGRLYGAAMGSPVSAVIANLYMEEFEEQAITARCKPKIWKRYVDGTFTILDRNNVDGFFATSQ